MHLLWVNWNKICNVQIYSYYFVHPSIHSLRILSRSNNNHRFGFIRPVLITCQVWLWFLFDSSDSQGFTGIAVWRFQCGCEIMTFDRNCGQTVIGLLKPSHPPRGTIARPAQLLTCPCQQALYEYISMLKWESHHCRLRKGLPPVLAPGTKVRNSCCSRNVIQ